MLYVHYHIEQSTPRTDKIFLDSAGGCGLSSLHLLNTGMYGYRTRQICGINLSGTLKGVSGWTGNILNTCRSLTYAVFNIPALLPNPLNRSM